MIRLSSDRSINSIIIKKEPERKKGSKNIYFTLYYANIKLSKFLLSQKIATNREVQT